MITKITIDASLFDFLLLNILFTPKRIFLYILYSLLYFCKLLYSTLIKTIIGKKLLDDLMGFYSDNQKE